MSELIETEREYVTKLEKLVNVGSSNYSGRV